jgi:kynureninase
MERKDERSRAEELDRLDELSPFREEFHFPDDGKGGRMLYFTGNSLGLQPKRARTLLEEELEDWARYGVEGHFKARRPWFSYHHFFKEPLARVVGARPEEVTAMNSLTTDLHLLMVSFYRPEKQRYRILCEGKPFPSDRYAFESQARFHGYDPEDAIIELHPRSGEDELRNEDVLSAIETYRDSLALVLFGGVNYYSGQAFPIGPITEKAHEVGAYAGFDLAHAAGNIDLQLHRDEVDFAAWCSYKYLNSGPGSVGGIFVNDRYGKDEDLIRFAGWWGHDEESRFRMEKGFSPMRGADGWQLSNAPVFAMAPHLASLELFDRAGMDALSDKRDRLTGFLEDVLDAINERKGGDAIELITPREKERRGAQLSFRVKGKEGRKVQDALIGEGVSTDFREPDVIRAAPVPLYNSFSDLVGFGERLERALGT